MKKTYISCRSVFNRQIDATLNHCTAGRSANAQRCKAKDAAAGAYGGLRRPEQEPDRCAATGAYVNYVALRGDVPGNPGSLAIIFSRCSGSET